MSDLQCAATFVLAVDGEVDGDKPDLERVGGLWTSPATLAAAEVVGARLGLAARPDPRLGPRGDEEQPHAAAARLADALWDISDLTRGETSLVLTHLDLVTDAVTSRCRNVTVDVTSVGLAAGETAVVEVDSDGWVCTRWGQRVFPK